jgi:DNA-binding response OmpR family regulator
MQIFLIEDNADLAEAIVVVMGPRHDVTSVTTGTEALEALDGASDEGFPDLIAVDLTLPDMSGVEAIRRLRRIRSDLPPILVVSAKPLAAIREEAEQMGAAAYLRKPFSLEELRDTVERVGSSSRHDAASP